MKSKQLKLKAKLPLTAADITNGAYSYSKQKERTIKIIDKTTEKCIVDCVISVGNSKNSSTVYADLWVSNIKPAKIPKNADYTYTVDSCYDNEPPKTYTTNSLSGKGKAGGYGYDKMSQAVQNAIDECGITLWGTPYHGQDADFKKRANVGGTGNHEAALLAIAYAIGYNNIILVGA